MLEQIEPLAEKERVRDEMAAMMTAGQTNERDRQKERMKKRNEGKSAVLKQE